MSENGPQFSAQEFARFAREWGVSQVKSSSTYRQSNGLAEEVVHTAEQLLKKARLEQRDPYLSLLEYRNAPFGSLATPAQLLISKRLRSILPTTSKHLRPRAVHPDIAIERLEKKHSKTLIYNQGARELKLLASGEEVHIQTKAVNWKPATVLGQCSICLTPCVPGTEESIAGRRHLLTTRSLSAKMSTATSESIKESESEPNQNPTDPGSLQ